AFPSTPSGKAFFQQTGYIGLADVTEQDLQTISVYTRITENILNQPSTLFVDETRKIVRKNVDSSS
ncbi:MAG: hypothetical protein LBB51_05260, partial [Zoogloeaceae bacterium]|nr:hypothetical protein [Zoogloeaceae bacterium]